MQQLHISFLEAARPNRPIRMMASQPEERHTDEPATPAAPPLTKRRRQVLILYLAGHPRKAIARRLGVSPHTVRNHIRAIYEDLGVANRVQALRWALEQPALASQILSHVEGQDQGTETAASPAASPRPVNPIDLVAEATSFYQRQVIQSPVEVI